MYIHLSLFQSSGHIVHSRGVTLPPITFRNLLPYISDTTRLLSILPSVLHPFSTEGEGAVKAMSPFFKDRIQKLDISPIHEPTVRTLGLQFSSVQSLSHVQFLATPWTAAHQASLSITNSRSLLKLMQIESVMLSNHLILCRPLLLLPSIIPSIRVFSNESALRMRWQKYWRFSFSISPSNEHPGLISFRMDWLDILAVQGTLKSLLQHHSSKASILRHSTFFTIQLSHPYMTTGKPKF